MENTKRGIAVQVSTYDEYNDLIKKLLSSGYEIDKLSLYIREQFKYHLGGYIVVDFDSKIITLELLDNFNYPISDNIEDFIKLARISTLKYHKFMLVSNDRRTWYKRLVLKDLGGYYIAWKFGQTCKEIEYSDNIELEKWTYAVDLTTKFVEITTEEIAEKFNTTVESLIIK